MTPARRIVWESRLVISQSLDFFTKVNGHISPFCLLFLFMTSPKNLTQEYFSGYGKTISCFYCGIIMEEVDETVNLARKHKISCEYGKRVIGSFIFQTWKKRYRKFKEKKKVPCLWRFENNWICSYLINNQYFLIKLQNLHLFGNSFRSCLIIWNFTLPRVLQSNVFQNMLPYMISYIEIALKTCPTKIRFRMAIPSRCPFEKNEE